MHLQELDGSYSILQYLPRTKCPEWVLESEFYSVSSTPDELSVVCESRVIKGKNPKVEAGWKCFRVLGSLDFSLTGVLAGIAKPLAEAEVSIFAVSTFETDYVLVKEDVFERARAALAGAGFTFVE